MKLDAIPYEIETPRLVLRCPSPTDAEQVFEATDASRAHLAPWVVWPDHHRSVADSRAWLRSARGSFELMQEFIFSVFLRDGTYVGGTGIHPRGVNTGVVEIGYWLAVAHTRQGYMREAVAALVEVAFGLARVERVEIRIEPENKASIAIPEALGFMREGIARAAIPRPGGNRDVAIYSKVRADLA